MAEGEGESTVVVDVKKELAAQRLQEEFYKAAYTNDLAALLLCTSKGVDVNETDEFGSTAIHFAAQHGNIEAVAMLIDNSAKVDHKNRMQSTPLHRAAREGHDSVVRLLLEKGASVNGQNLDLSTPLHLAAEWNRPDIIRLLLTSGAKADLKNKDGKSPIELSPSSQAKAAFSGAAAPASSPRPKVSAESKPIASNAAPVATTSGTATAGVYAALDKILLRTNNEKELAATTKAAVEDIKKIIALNKASQPALSSDLEKATSEIVIAVKGVLVARGKEQSLDAPYATLTKTVDVVKSISAKLASYP